MPTIEIVSIGATQTSLIQEQVKIAIIIEQDLISHRGIFQKQLNLLKGIIIHIGNPCFINNKEHGYFAGDIINWSFKEDENIIEKIITWLYEIFKGGSLYKFKFKPEYCPDIDFILKSAIEDSPKKEILFLTDIQWGRTPKYIEEIHSIANFWKSHDNTGLRFNTLYKLITK